VSLIVAAAIIWSLSVSINATIKVFGIWAIFSGLLQLSASLRRWKSSNGQWAMILSGAQSALAGIFMFRQASSDMHLNVTTVAPYAAFIVALLTMAGCLAVGAGVSIRLIRRSDGRTDVSGSVSLPSRRRGTG